MQSTTTAYHHLRRHHNHHHHDIFNPNPNFNPNSDPNSEPPKPNPKLLSLLLKSIIMILITSLFFIFLSIATLVVLHFFLAGGHAHHRRRRRRATPSDLLRFLPAVQYDAGLDGGGEDCAVCLEFFKGGEWCRTLPDCGHVFHAGCVDKWLIRRDNCPVCRARVRLELGGPTGSAMGDGDYKVFWALGV